MPDPTFKSSYTGQQIEEAIAKALQLEANTVISSNDETTAAIGGIPKGTNLNGKTVVEVLTDMLFTEKTSHYVDGETLVLE